WRTAPGEGGAPGGLAGALPGDATARSAYSRAGPPYVGWADAAGGSGEGDRTPSAERLWLHARTAKDTGGRSDRLRPCHPKEGALRVFRVGDGGYAEVYRHTGAHRDRLPERHAQSAHRAVRNSRVRRA